MTLKHRLVAVALGVFGGSWILYGDLIGPLPGTQPVGWLMVPAGVASVVVAGALHLGWDWGRWPAIVLSAVLIVSPPLAYGWGALEVAGLNVSILVDLLAIVPGCWIIHVLLTDWPPRATQQQADGGPPE